MGEAVRTILVGSIWRHRKTRGLYTVRGLAHYKGEGPLDGEPMVLYSDGEGLWIRPRGEFRDRFEEVWGG